jgi:rhamnose transport system permease protein
MLLIPRMLTAESINGVFLWLSILLVIAVGEALVILTGGIDISIGSTLAFSGMVVGLILEKNPTLGAPICFLIGGASGIALGIINGLLISRAKFPPLIATIATLATFRGFAFLISGGKTITSSMVPDSLIDLSKQGLTLNGLIFNSLLMVSLFVFCSTGWFLKNTRFGRNIFAVGSEPIAAYRRGIPQSTILLFVYSAAGFCSGLGGVMYLARFATLNPGTAGGGYELTVIAATVLGGTKLSGGRVSMIGIFGGCLFLSMLNVGLSLVGIPADWQLLVYGTVLIGALVANRWRAEK